MPQSMLRNTLICLLLSTTAAGIARADPTPAQQQQAADLSRKAVDLIDAGKLADAELALRQSLAIVPAQPTRLYNLASVLAGGKKFDDAMTALEQATDAGFTDFTNLARNRSFASLHGTPRYEKLLGRRELIFHHAAEQAIAALRRQLGEHYLYDADEPHKLIFAVAIDRAALELLKSDLLTIESAEESEVFSYPPDEFVRIVIPSEADFARIVPSPHLGGDYDDTTRTAVSMRLGQFMTHEFTHALHAADQHAREQEHPIWLSEGLASLYEPAEIDNEKLISHDNSRLKFVQFAAKGGQLIPLEKLLAMSRQDFNDRPNLAYGEAGCVLEYLRELGQLRAFYDAYTAGYGADQTGKTALQQVTGAQLPAIEKELAQWIIDRPEPPSPARPGGPIMGMNLADVIDGLRITQVGRETPAAAADIRGGDVITGVDGREVRDRPTIDRVIGAREPGDKVQLRVRRGTEYLDVELVLGKRSP
jgi:hypothetical protein